MNTSLYIGIILLLIGVKFLLWKVCLSLRISHVKLDILHQYMEEIRLSDNKVENSHLNSESIIPANRKPRTAEQKKKASEMQKARWEEKRRQQEADAKQII